MSLKEIEEKINDFLCSEEPQVIAITGNWGVGKTYAWNKTYAEFEKGSKKYSYVSLTSISSVSDLKRALVSDMLAREYNVPLKTKKVLSSVAQFIKNLNFHGLSLSMLDLSSFYLNDMVVCIDDMDRNKGNLSTRELLGFLTELKEIKNCKIVLIFNDKKIDDVSRSEYNELKEKVIDISVPFELSPSEAAVMVFEVASENFEILKDFSTKLKITNIRILQRIRRLAEKVIELLAQDTPNALREALHSLVLFLYSKYPSDDTVPNINYILEMGHMTEHKNVTWNDLLRNYGYDHSDDLDLIIARIVENESIDKQALHAEAKKVEEQHGDEKKMTLLPDAWKLYRDSFDDNGDAVCEAFYQAGLENIYQLSPSNLDSLVCKLRKLQEDMKANELVDMYCEKRHTEKKLFDLEQYAFSSHVKDSYLIEKFKENLNSSIDISVKSFFEKLKSTQCTREELHVMQNISVDDYFLFFKKELSGDLFVPMVQLCIVHGGENVKSALRKIAGESLINKLRVEDLGISYMQ